MRTKKGFGQVLSVNLLSPGSKHATVAGGFPGISGTNRIGFSGRIKDAAILTIMNLLINVIFLSDETHLISMIF